jgi:hypothetical protein
MLRRPLTRTRNEGSPDGLCRRVRRRSFELRLTGSVQALPAGAGGGSERHWLLPGRIGILWPAMPGACAGRGRNSAIGACSPRTTPTRRSVRSAGRSRDDAEDAGRLGDATIKSDELDVESLRQGDVTGVVDREVVAQVPRPRRQELVGPQLDRQIDEVGVSQGRLI